MRTLKTLAAAGLLLGATSAMAQSDAHLKSSGNFIFKVPSAFTLECDDDNATLEENQILDMTVKDNNALENAVAYIECSATSTRSQWSLFLEALHEGKMVDTTSGDTLKITENGVAEPGVLGLWVKFTESYAFDATDGSNTGANTVDIGTLNGSNLKTKYIENGTPVPNNGGFLKSLTGKQNVADNLDGVNLFGVRTTTVGGGGGDKTITGFTFRIHGAIVTPGEIVSPEGEYMETVEVTIDTVI